MKTMKANLKAEYEVVRNPTTGKYVVVGFIGRNKAGRRQYIPVSDGFATRVQAVKHISHLRNAIAASIACLDGI